MMVILGVDNPHGMKLLCYALHGNGRKELKELREPHILVRYADVALKYSCVEQARTAAGPHLKSLEYNSIDMVQMLKVACNLDHDA